jgi:tRNA(Ile2) C34 agmatinyltransferase TiaS
MNTCGTALAGYRERTEKMDQTSMNHIAWNYTFKCPNCHQTKPTAGRVARGWRKGFRCADCEVKRLEVKAAKKAAREAK